jgi:membrane fusion protein (multidrug efflux system)
MKPASLVAGGALVAALVAGGWVVVFHGEWIRKAPEAEEEAKVDTEVPVHTAKIVRTTLRRYVDGYGTVVPEPAHDGKPAAGAKLAAPVAGVLAQALCAEGDRVEKGATLFQLDARVAAAEEQKAAASVVSSQATIPRLAAALAYAERELARTQELRKENLASEKDLRDAELRLTSARNDVAEARAKAAEAEKVLASAQTQRSMMAIKAPLAGTVVHVYVSPGEAVDVNPSTVIAEIVDLDRLVVSATLPATELPALTIGQPVELRVAERARDPAVAARADDAADAGAIVHDAKLSFVGLQVDTKTDTVPVRVSVPRDAGLRPGQYLRLRIAVEERADCLAVPVEAAVTGGEGETVIAVVEGGKAVQRPVHAGVRDRGLVEVSGEGLKEGMTVVAAGAYGLPKETKVRIVGE